MQILKRCVIGIFALIIIIAAAGFFIPSGYHVERNIVIEAPVAKVYDQVRDLRHWRHWGVWFDRDPRMTVSYTGPVGGVGMKSVWQSDTEGNGEMTITDIKINKAVVYNLAFPDFGMQSEGVLKFEFKDNKTYVTWSNHGDFGNNPFNRYFGLVMDSIVGPDFEAGLQRLKKLTEQS